MKIPFLNKKSTTAELDEILSEHAYRLLSQCTETEISNWLAITREIKIRKRTK